MNWTIEFAREAVRELDKLDRQVARRILKFLRDRVGNLEDPRSIGSALKDSKLGEVGKYSVGGHRIICRIEDDRLLILVLRIGHRREIYR